MSKRHGIMDFFLIFQPPYYKVHTVSALLHNIKYFLDSLRMPIEFQHRGNIRVNF